MEKNLRGRAVPTSHCYKLDLKNTLIANTELIYHFFLFNSIIDAITHASKYKLCNAIQSASFRVHPTQIQA